MPAEQATNPLSHPDAQPRRQCSLVLVIIVSLAFAWILWPFFGAVLWAAMLAIVFAPLHRRLLKSMPRQQNLASLATLLIIVTLVILPVTLAVASLVEEAANLHQRIQAGELDFGRVFQQVMDALPAWVTDLLDRLGLANLGAIKERLSAALVKGSSFFAAQALDIGWGTANFIIGLSVMLYLLFFFVRDGDAISDRITHAIPLPADQRALISKSTAVIRAMAKGNLLVAAVQAALGGFIFWFLGIHAPVLWAVVFALVALLPGVSSAVIWLPVVIYLLATGAVWQGGGPDRIWHLRHGLRGQLSTAASRRQRHANARLPCTDLHAWRDLDFQAKRIHPGPGGRGAVYCRMGHLLGVAA